MNNTLRLVDGERPMSDHAERTVLGACLVDEGSFIEACETLTPESFALDAHRRIFAAMHKLHEKQYAIDIVTISEVLRGSKELDSIGGVPYLAELSEGIPRKLSIASYAKVIHDKFLLRGVQDVANLALDAANEQQLDGARTTLLAMAERIDEMQSQVKATETHTLASVAVEFWNTVLEERKRNSKLVGIPTGVDTLDDYTTGWRDGELTYVGALPGRGKTAFMLQAFVAALKSGVPAGFISLEMTREQLLRRIALAESNLATYKWRDVRLMSPTDMQYAREATFKLGELQGYVADAANMNPAEISALARRWSRVYGIRILFVDFVQIIREDGRDRREAINRVSATLRDTCKSLRIPFVVASQLARRDNDPNRRPTLQDLRESGNLEQDAHNVLMLYRPREADEENGGVRWTGEDEIIVEKSREGRMGSVLVRFNENALRFEPRNP